MIIQKLQLCCLPWSGRCYSLTVKDTTEINLRDRSTIVPSSWTGGSRAIFTRTSFGIPIVYHIDVEHLKQINYNMKK